MPPNKLKSGFGEGVTEVLLKLATISVQNKFRNGFKKPVIRDDGAGLDDDAEEMGDDMDGGADMADEIQVEASDDEIEDELEFGGGNMHNDLAKQMEADMQQNAIIQSSISKEKWQLEVERVAHRLKINKAGADGKEWRSHLDQTKKYADQVKTSLPDVRFKLERLQEEASKALEKISKKEQLLSRSF